MTSVDVTAGKPAISIVVPVYNRESLIERALRSAKDFLEHLGGGEIVVVDDGSTDASAAKAERVLSTVVGERFATRLVRSPTNCGVNAAKNAGAKNARGEWLLFLDSDDELIPSSASAFQHALQDYQSYPLHFFRCIDEIGKPVGEIFQQPVLRGLRSMLEHGTSGESLPVARRDVFQNFLYDEDLQGFEGLSYFRITKAYGESVIHPLVVRKYYTAHADRLSSRAGLRRRSSSLAKGYLRLLDEHRIVMGSRARVRAYGRWAYHAMRASVFRWYRR